MSTTETRPPQGKTTNFLRSLTSNPAERITEVWILLMLVGLVIIFSVLEGSVFFNLANFGNIAVDASELLLIAVGTTFVIITSGIDLSVGSVLVFASVVAAKVMVALAGTPAQVQNGIYPNQGLAIVAGIVLGVLAGLLWGIVNGVLITRLKVPPFIVTLGTLGMSLGAALILSGGVNVPFVPPAVQAQIGAGTLLGFLPIPVAVAIVVVVIAALALSRTRFGRYTYAIGSNEQAARKAGINVDMHLIKIYALSGLLAGLAGVMDVARFSTASVGAHTSDNLSAIAGVVIGGTSLFGGAGTIIGTVVGIFIPAILANGFVIQGVQPFWQQVAIGAILILAVFIDQQRRRAQSQKR
jgi:ribose transport system permease protein